MNTKLNIIETKEQSDLGTIFVARLRQDDTSLVEFVDTRDPRYPVSEKWVSILSTQFGCAVNCTFCDAGGSFHGNLTAPEMLSLIDYLVERRFPDREVKVPKWKLHFARMGEPSLNPAVLDLLVELPSRYNAPNLIPTIPTLAANDDWFERLLEIKNRYYTGGRFQLQFSANSTDEKTRDRLMPVRKWNLERIAGFGPRWFRPGDRKLTLNFALAEGFPFSVDKVADLFDPDCFLLKFTPINPTEGVTRSGLVSVLTCEKPDRLAKTVEILESKGFEVLISIGADEENQLGSNCGQAVSRLRREAAVKA